MVWLTLIIGVNVYRTCAPDNKEGKQLLGYWVAEMLYMAMPNEPIRLEFQRDY